MQKDIPSAGNERRAPTDAREPTPQPLLRMRPTHFFSADFRLERVDEDAQWDESRHADQHRRAGDARDWAIVRMIGVVGVPALLYCVASSL